MAAHLKASRGIRAMSFIPWNTMVLCQIAATAMTTTRTIHATLLAQDP